MGLNLLFLPFWSIFIVIPFGRFFLLPGKSWIVFVSCRSMDFSPWCELSPGPNECVGCNCVDEAEVFAPTTPPGYYSSSFVGEGRSGMSRPTTSCKLPVAHYRSVDSPGPVVVLFYYCLHLRSSCVVLPPYFYHWTCLSYQTVRMISNHFCYLFVWWTWLTSATWEGRSQVSLLVLPATHSSSPSAPRPGIVTCPELHLYLSSSAGTGLDVYSFVVYFLTVRTGFILPVGHFRFQLTSGSFNLGCVNLIVEFGLDCFPPERQVSGVCQIV